MNLDLYNEIIYNIRRHKGYPKDLQNYLIAKYPNVPKETLLSIVSTQFQKIALRCNHKNSDVIDGLFNMYLINREAQDEMQLDRKKILSIAVTQNIPATLVARVILNKFYEKDQKNKKPTKKNISDMLAYSYLIDDSDLSLEVFWATLYDEHYSPVADLIKQHIGYENECKLRYCCQMEKMAFKDENALRKEGYNKTPDIKLELPVLINGVAITWIESKALFADIEIHENYTREQYLSYWNRWGAGMIIYWFGFTEDVIHPTEKRFIVVDDFPSTSSITHLKYALQNNVDNTVDKVSADVDKKLKIVDKKQSTSNIK